MSGAPITLEELSIVLTDQGMDGLIARIKQLDENTKKSKDTLESMQGVLVAIGGLAIAQKLGNAFKQSFADAMQAESAMTAYKASVDSAGASVAAYGARAEAASKKIEHMSRFSDEDALDAMSRMTQITGSASEGLRGMTAAAGLAAAKKIDLATAAQLVGRADLGMTTALQRQGIVLDKNKDAIDQLASRFGKFITSDANTAEGQMKSFANALNDVSEEIGNVVTQSGAFHVVMSGITDFLRVATVPGMASFTGELGFIYLGLTALIVVIPPTILLVSTLSGAFKEANISLGAFGLALLAVNVAVGVLAYSHYKDAQAIADEIQGVSDKPLAELKKIQKGYDDQITALAAKRDKLIRDQGAALYDAHEGLKYGTNPVNGINDQIEKYQKLHDALDKVIDTKAKLDTSGPKFKPEDPNNVALKQVEMLNLLVALRGEEVTAGNDVALMDERIMDIATPLRFQYDAMSNSLRNGIVFTKGQADQYSALASAMKAVTDAGIKTKNTIDLGSIQRQAMAMPLAGVAGVDAADIDRYRKQIEHVFVELVEMSNTGTSHLDSMKILHPEFYRQIEDGIAQGFSDAIYNGFKRGFSGGGIGGIMQGFASTALVGLGNIFIGMGKKMIEGASLFKAFIKFLELANPEGGILMGIAMIGLGSAMAAAGGAVGGAAGAAGGTRGTIAGPSYGSPISRNSIGVSGATGAQLNVQPKPSLTVNATIIGRNDPQAQDEIMALIRNAYSRGYNPAMG